jgi:hypothetical protein
MDDGLGLGVGFGATLIAGLIATPLFQTNLLPCLTQEYLMLETVLVVPALVHLVPAMDAEKAGIPMRTNEAVNEKAANFLTRAISIAKSYKP